MNKGFAMVGCLRAACSLASAISCMRAAGAGRAHSLASSIVFSFFCIVSLVSIYISLVIMISEHTVATAVVNGGQSVWMTHGPREQRRWRGICAACACQMRQRPAGRRPASGQCLKHHIQLLTGKRVLPCESMGVAGEARARVLRACRVRGGRVCWCASAEQARGRGGGEGQGRGEPGARRGLTSLFVRCTKFCAPCCCC